MKYKKMLAALAARQKAWDSMSPAAQKGTKRPGSVKGHGSSNR